MQAFKIPQPEQFGVPLVTSGTPNCGGRYLLQFYSKLKEVEKGLEELYTNDIQTTRIIGDLTARSNAWDNKSNDRGMLITKFAKRQT